MAFSAPSPVSKHFSKGFLFKFSNFIISLKTKPKMSQGFYLQYFWTWNNENGCQTQDSKTPFLYLHVGNKILWKMTSSTKSPWSLWRLGSQFLQQFQWETELKNPQEVLFLFQTSEICWRSRVVAYQNKNNFHVGFWVVESQKYHFDLNISDIFHTGCHSWRKSNTIYLLVFLE